MTNRTRLIGGAALLLAAFLLGFVPQYRTASGLRSDLRAAQDEVLSLRSKMRLAELRDLINLTYLEANAKNFGVARQHSTRFFTRAGEVAAETSEPTLKKLLTEIYGERDQITAGLAEGKSGVQADLERLARRLHKDTMQ
jgi:hypothetical protein